MVKKTFVVPQVFALDDHRNYQIREAQLTDAKHLLQYLDAIAYESNFLSFGPNELQISIEEEVNIIKKSKSRSNCLYIVAEFENRIVGVLTVKGSVRPRLVHIGEFGISVRKEFWGMGIGSRLLDMMELWASSNAVIRKLNLRVQVTNTKAIALYKKYGYEIEGRIRRDTAISNQFIDTYAMGKLFD